MGKLVDTVESRIQKAILTAIGSIITPKIELAYKSINSSTRRDEINVMAISERGEHTGITAPLEIVSERNKTLHLSKVKGETRYKILDEVSELSLPYTHFDRQPHTHHMVTGQKAQANQIPELFTGRTLTPR